ncbi:MAG: hypothetical protein ACLFSY_02180 [Desulfonatronovibrionaceae bacterium]
MNRFYPAIHRRRLYILAALLWTAAGVLLVARALSSLAPLSAKAAGPLIGAGIVLGAVGYLGPFSSLARKNMRRIREKPDRSCAFGFQAGKSYFLIGGMIILGLALKNSFLPVKYLAVLYLAVGTALLLSTLLYYPRIFGAEHDEN